MPREGGEVVPGLLEGDHRRGTAGVTHVDPLHVRPVKGAYVEATGGKTVYISGQIALDKDGKVVGEGDMKAQAEQVFKNLQTALASAGATFKDVVKMNTYTTDMSQVQPIRDVRARYFGDTVPASTLVQVVHLARPEFMLEIEVIAIVP